MVAASPRVTNAQLLQSNEALINRADLMYGQMREMWNEIKATPRYDPNEIAGLRVQLTGMSDRLIRIESGMGTLCKRVEDLETAKGTSNGKSTEVLTRLTVLEEHDKAQNKTLESTLGKAWTIIQAVLLLVLTAIVSGLWKP